jgi:hypothetical protein
MTAPLHDPIAPWCADVIGLFAGPLGDVHFPDVDATILSSAAAAVHEAQREVESLEHALALARTRARDSNAALAELCSRGLAYARVFSSAQPELAAAIAGMRAPTERVAPELAPKKRGRPRKDAATVALLPDDDAAVAQ